MNLTTKEYQRANDTLAENQALQYSANADGAFLANYLMMEAVLTEIARTNVILRRIESTLDQIEIHSRRIK